MPELPLHQPDDMPKPPRLPAASCQLPAARLLQAVVNQDVLPKPAHAPQQPCAGLLNVACPTRVWILLLGLTTSFVWRLMAFHTLP